MVAARAHGVRNADALDEVSALFPVLRAMWRRRDDDLSGGRQQQLAIGRVLVGQPRLPVMDPPAKGIQPSIKDIEAAITGLRGRMSILLVKQYHDFARSLADCYAVLGRGTVVTHGKSSQVSREAIGAHISIFQENARHGASRNPRYAGPHGAGLPRRKHAAGA